jgi:hypothetical protein
VLIPECFSFLSGNSVDAHKNPIQSFSISDTDSFNVVPKIHILLKVNILSNNSNWKTSFDSNLERKRRIKIINCTNLNLLINSFVQE